MKKIYFLIFLTSTFGYSQVGVGTTNPQASLDVVATNPTGATTSVDGILIPRVDRQRAQSMTGTITSTMIFVNSVATGSAAGTAINITSTGFYYYDGAVWQKIAAGASTDWALSGNGSTSPGTNLLVLLMRSTLELKQEELTDGIFRIPIAVNYNLILWVAIRLLFIPFREIQTQVFLVRVLML